MAYGGEGALISQFENYIFKLEELLLEGKKFSRATAGIPFAVHLNDPVSLEILQSNDKHAELTGYCCDQIREMGSTYSRRYIHPISVSMLSQFLPKIYETLAVHQVFAFISYMRFPQSMSYAPIFTFSKPSTLPSGLVICISVTVEEFGKYAPKMEQVIEMDLFRMRHFKWFEQLTDREVEVLGLLGEGNTNNEIAEQLFISPQTAKTHRKNIKRKLEPRSFKELMKYALAFNLVDC